jgi:hypothetical protein
LVCPQHILPANFKRAIAEILSTRNDFCVGAYPAEIFNALGHKMYPSEYGDFLARQLVTEGRLVHQNGKFSNLAKPFLIKNIIWHVFYNQSSCSMTNNDVAKTKFLNNVYGSSFVLVDAGQYKRTQPERKDDQASKTKLLFYSRLSL